MSNPISKRVVLLAPAVFAMVIAGSTAAENENEKPSADAKPSISWMTDLDEGFRLAKTDNRPIILDFWASWCQPCKMLDKMTFSDPAVIKTSKKFVTMRVNVDTAPRIVLKYKVSGYPTVVFLDSGGDEVYRRSGVVPAEEFLPIMNDVVAGKNPDKVLAALSKSPPEKVPDDPGTLWRLVRMCLRTQKEKESVKFLEKLMSLPADEVPNRPGVVRFLGMMYARTDMPDKFNDLADRSKKSDDPEIARMGFQLELAWATDIEKDNEKAVEIARDMLDRTNDPGETAYLNRLIEDLTLTESGEDNGPESGS